MKPALGPAAFGGVIAAAALAYDPSAPAADPKRALGLLFAVALLAAAIARAPRPAGTLRASPAALLFLAFVAWSGVTLVYGVPLGARDLGSWAAAAVVILVTLRWPLARARVAAGWAALLTGGGAAVIGVAQAVGGARGIFVHGGQGNANWLGLLLAVTIPLTCGLLHLRAARALVAGSLVLQVAGLLLSHSRVAWAATLVTAVPLVLHQARRWLRSRRAATVVAAAAIGFALAAAPARAVPAAPAPAAAADVPIPLAWKGRTWIWRTSADAALASLPAGAGLGGFAHAYLDAQGKRLASLPVKEAARTFLNATTAHCDWLEVLVDSGPPALLLLVLAAGAAVLSALRSRWLPGAAALVAFAVCACGDSPLRQPGLVLVLGLALGACPRTVVVATRDHGPSRVLAASRIALLVVCALLLAVSARTWMGQRRLTAARDAAPDEQHALLASAANLDPTSGEIALERGLRLLDQGQVELARRELRRSRPLLASVAADVAIGNAELLLGRPEPALTAYRAALARNPASFRALADISQPLLTLGRFDEAEAHLAAAAELWPGHPHLQEMIDRAHRARLDREAN